MAEMNNDSLGKSVKITVSDGVRLTSNWRLFLRASGQSFQTKGFLIPVESLKQLLETNPEAQGVRAYLGLQDAQDPSSGNLVLVPVVNGEDIIYLPGSGRDGDDEDDSNLYDRSSPCPPLCGPPNELNH